MKIRLMAACLAAIAWLPNPDGVARAQTPAPTPFPEVEVEPVVHRSHLTANLTLLAGAGLIAASFPFRDQANRHYNDYLIETDPARIQDLYDRTVRADRLSSASLVSGELLLAAGLYLRFLRRPVTEHLELSLLPDRCIVSLRF